MFETISTINILIWLTGAFLGGMVIGMLLTMYIVFDGVSIQIGGKGKQTLDLSIGETDDKGDTLGS